MRQSKKILSFLLAIVLILTTVAIGASAKSAPFKDSAIAGQYNSLDKPVLTTEQYATAALDEVDRMLAEEQLHFTKDDIVVGDLDLTSVDNALDSVVALVEGSLWQNFKGMLGDLYNLNVNAIKTYRRRSTSSTDLDVINSLLQFLYDNKQLFVDFVSGDIDLGSIVGMFVDLSNFNVSKMAKGFIYEFAYDKDAPDNVTQSVDQMAQDIIDKYVVNGYVKNGATVAPLAPELKGHTNISSGSAYDFVDTALKILYNEKLIPLANTKGIEAINKALAKYPNEISAYAKYFNLTADGKCNFTFPTFSFTSDTFLSQLNNVIGSIINTVLTDELGYKWQSGKNATIVTNIIEIGKKVLVNTGDTFFASYVEIKTPAELNKMTDMQICAYVARTIINSSVRGVMVPNTAETLVEVANYAAKGIMATELPGRDYSDTTAYPNDSVDTILNVMADFAVKSLNDWPGLGLSYGIGIDAVLTAFAKWGIENYGGLLSGINLNKNDSGWTNVDKLVFSIINRNWIDASQFPSGKVNTEELIKDILLKNILNLNFDPIFTLIETNPSGSELNNSVKQVILNVVSRTINIVFPGLLSTSMTTFDDIIEAKNLSNTVNALFTDLNSYRATLAKAVLPIVCDALSLTTAQSFKSPRFNLDSFNFISSGSANLSLKITNPSMGINTGYTDANGVFHQDSRYAYKIKSVTSNLSSIKIAQPGSAALNGGDSISLSITGSFTQTQNFIVEVTYDVLTENGTALTSEPLVARLYSCLSTTDTDETAQASAKSGNYAITGGEKNIYVTSVRGLDDLSYKVKNSSDATVTATATSAKSGSNKHVADLSFVDVNSKSVDIVKGAQTTIDIYDVNDTYTGTEAQDLEAFTANGFCRYYQTSGVKMGSTSLTAASNIILYKDYGLHDLFNSEVSAQRQSYDYSSSTAWTNYLNAMKAAAELINGKKSATRFCLTSAVGTANKFKGVATTLQNAVDALKASAAGGGVESTLALMKQVEPSNEGLTYTDSGYSFFSSSNFVTYTFNNFRKEYRAASRFADGYAVRDELGNYVLDSNGNKTYTAADSLSVQYKNHRLSLYYGRLLAVDGNKLHLAKEIAAANAAGYVADNYTAASYANLTKALAFANSVNNEADPVQKKINTAYVELVEAQKRLIKAGGSEEPEITITVATKNPGDPNYAPEIVTNAAGENLLLGVYPEEFGYDIADYFSVSGGNVTFEYDSIATGSVVNVKDSNGKVVYTFIIVIAGDIDQTGEVDGSDLAIIDSAASGYEEFSETFDSAYDYAGDLDGSGDISPSDVYIAGDVVSGSIDFNFAARTAEE